MLTKFKAKPFDINGDGKVDINDIRAIFTGERYHQPSTMESLVQDIKTLWTKNQPTFDALGAQIQERKRLLKASFIKKWITRNGTKIEKILLKLAELFGDKKLISLRSDFRSLNRKISALEGKISALKAEGAFSGSPKSKSINKLEDDLISLSERRAFIVKIFKDQLLAYEIELTDDAAEHLLARIDSSDICQLISIFFAITQIASQLELAKAVSNENLEVSKKYYAVFVGLLEVQICVQDNYVRRMDEIYLPSVTELMDRTKVLASETQILRKDANDELQETYLKNVSAQQLAIEALTIYREQLTNERDKVVSARAMVKERHKLAVNTLDTVSIAGELTGYLRQTDSLYANVMSLQTPMMAPFENLELKSEFLKIASRLEDMTS